MIKSKHVFFLSILIIVFITFVFRDIPFFWDGTYFSKAATLFYNGTDSFWSCGEYTDNTTLPLFSWYLNIVWSLFSKTLTVSHFAFLPFMILFFYEYYRFSKKFLSDFFCSVALILLLSEPTFSTQALLMGYDILMVFLFFFLINRLIENKFLLYSFILPVLSLYSIRGLMLGASLFFIHLAINYSQKKKTSLVQLTKVYSPTIILVCSWFLYHKLKTGWFLFSPLHENTDEQILSFSMAARQVFYVFWKLADFGRIYLWLFVLSFLFIAYYYKKQKDEKTKLLSIVLFIPIIITSLLMIFVSNPIGHKYFIFCFAVLIVFFCWVLQQLNKKQLSSFIAAAALLFLVSGNFWMYPQKYGNGWDSSLKVLPYFNAKTQMDEFVKTQKIDPNNIATQFPLNTNELYSNLTDSSYCYSSVETEEISNYEYFLYSNITNSKSVKTIEEIKSNWKLLREHKSGAVTVSLYQKQ